jgi:putative flippase GtrA
MRASAYCRAAAKGCSDAPGQMRKMGLSQRSQAARYALNGLVATAVHDGALRLQMEALGAGSAARANFVAALCGIATSFVGSRWYVFRKLDEPVLRQMRDFGLLYGAIAVLHAGFLGLWTDRLGLDYTAGFGIALVMQVVGSFFGNKYLVFRS